MARLVGQILVLIFFLTVAAAVATCGMTLMGCTVPLIPVEDQWKIERWGEPLPYPSPADPWLGGYGGGPVHE